MQDRSRVSDNEFPIQEEEEEENNVPFDDSPEPRQDSSLVSATPDYKRTSLAISGLDIVADDTMEEDKKETPKNKPKRRVNRRKRKIDIDNDKTELTTAHIKAMLGNTSDIVRQNRTHPADYTPKDNDDETCALQHVVIRPWKKQKGVYHEEVASLPYEILLERPNIADDGALAPELLHLWKKNASRLRGEPLPFRMEGAPGDAQRSQIAEEIMNTAAKEEDVEIARNTKIDEQRDDSRLSVDPENVNESDELLNVQQEDPLQELDGEIPNPFDDEDDQQRREENEDGFGMLSPARSEDSQQSHFSLGAVNDLEDEISGESRQEQGDVQVSSGSKWHKHTVKVLGMLKENMDTSEKNENEPNYLSYDKLSIGVSRRTACGVFFELLQLKTWDFIELDQEESYADIKIAPGTRFHEDPPKDS